MSVNVNRRDFLRVLGIGGVGVGAGLTAGCYPKSPRGEFLESRLTQPPEQTPGNPVFYATTWPDAHGCGVLARTREGRVVKLEGNPAHTATGGGLSARGQAAIQGLYNPHRLGAPKMRMEDGSLQECPWSEAIGVLAARLRGGASRAAWLIGDIPDSERDAIELIADQMGTRAPVRLALEPEAPRADAANALFGTEGMPEILIDQATMLVSVGADFLESWGAPVAQIAAYTKMHAHREGVRGRSVYVGARQSSTAASCDEWVKILPGREAAALRVIIDGILHSGHAHDAQAAEEILRSVSLADAEAAVGDAAESLRHIGEALAGAEAPLVIAAGHGPDPKLTNALALMATHLAGGGGRTVRHTLRPPRGDSFEVVERLFADVQSGAVRTLIIHSANPAFMIPGSAEVLSGDAFVVCLGTQDDETMALADLILPTHHWLESWGDHVISPGVSGLMQPVMLPVPRQVPPGQRDPNQSTRFFNSRPAVEILFDVARAAGASDALLWESAEAYHMDRLQTFHQGMGIREPFDQFAHRVKRDGVIEFTESNVSVTLQAGARIGSLPEIESGTLQVLFPHPLLYDGRDADKPWLQETPETSTSAVWGTWAEIHPETAAAMGIGRHDGVQIQRPGGGTITVPALITEQVIPGIVAVPLGQGHTALRIPGEYPNRIGKEAISAPVGANAFLIAGDEMTLEGYAVDVTAVAGGGRDLLRTGAEQDQRGRQLARAIPVANVDDPDQWHTFHEQHYDHRNLDSLYPEHGYPTYDWGMAVDLDACVGCGACVVACQAENNIPVVGPNLVREGREMAWIRIEKYVEAGDDVRHLPAMCQHCHNAPCEPVCPVHAAYHTEEGLNGQVYNRCVGTRYCSNNCSYKQRRFNWFDYNTLPEPMNLLWNPDVTIRERGVMEKCTLCVQRIKEKKMTVQRDGRRVVEDSDGLTPACAQTCPAKVFTFGNLIEEGSEVNRLAAQPRGYQMLSDLGHRPSVNYLKKVLRGDSGGGHMESEGSGQHHG